MNTDGMPFNRNAVKLFKTDFILTGIPDRPPTEPPTSTRTVENHNNVKVTSFNHQR